MKALKIASAAVAAILAVAALLLIAGVPSGLLASAIQHRVERETGYRLTIAGSTRIGLWPSLKVTIGDVTLERPQDRDAGHRLTAGSIEAGMTLGSVWSGRPRSPNSPSSARYSTCRCGANAARRPNPLRPGRPRLRARPIPMRR